MIINNLRKLTLLSVISILFVQVFFCFVVTADMEDGVWSVEYQVDNKKSTTYFSCSKTDTYIFFGYGKAGVIDAYNQSGKYLFSLRYNCSTSNRYMSIRCDDNLLYVSSHGGQVYIFDGNALIKTLSYDEAKSSGYDATWFSEETLWANKEHVYSMNEDGVWIEFMKTPKEVSQNMPLINLAPENEWKIVIIVVIVGIFVFSILGIVIIKRHTKSQG